MPGRELVDGPFVRVADRDDPGKLALLHDGQVADLEPRHVIGGLGDVGLRVDGVEVRRHALGDLRGLGVAALGNEVHEVALGHDAGELVALETTTEEMLCSRARWPRVRTNHRARRSSRRRA